MSYAVETDGYVECRLCPHGCRIAPGHSGICRVRSNEAGVLALPYFGIASGVSMDPIEKKPLYHFYPGRSILSIGFYGCNLRCPFCQNYDISQRVTPQKAPISPGELVDIALGRNSVGIAYTYSESVVHFEYVVEAAKIARRQGLKNVLVSNGFLNPEPAAELLDLMDAANIDLKSFSDDFYEKELKGALGPVLEFIKLASKRVFLEVTTLIIPGKNDSKEEISEIAGFLGAIDRGIPLHLSCYYPTYKYSIQATAPETVYLLAEIARDKLHFVYAGNVGGVETNTMCPSCNSLLVQRRGYYTEWVGISRERCKACGTEVRIPGV
ncbi:MAG: AmmeMemoRadiSam system radical SAM enzyme [Spirochaetales bacterium]|nr:AmmeMemoRadiSam system radical SAM enzyme [Spirochaetales bacterium]